MTKGERMRQWLKWERRTTVEIAFGLG